MTGLGEAARLEIWAFQCKHRKTWSDTQTKEAILKAEAEFPEAKFYFLLVTCELGRKARDEAFLHGRWQMWSREDITSAVRMLPNRDQAARMLNTFFGPHWAEAVLGIPGEGPLLASGAFFVRQMTGEPLHHHQAEIVGRVDELAALRGFLGNREKRLLILPGAGGCGKSRLLKALADSLSPAERRRWSLRFYENQGGPLSPKDRDAMEGEPVILIDDAHREQVEPLLKLILRSPKAKVILSTRPQGIPILREAAVAAGVGALMIEERRPLRRLDPVETVKVVKRLLGTDYDGMAEQVARSSRDCLLIAVVACEMVKKQLLTKAHLESHQEFEHEVFQRLIGKSIAGLELIAPPNVLDRLLESVSLLAPMPRDGPWFEVLVKWAGAETKPHDVSRWIDGLERAGLLRQNREGYRISPDLLSDYVLYRAVYGDKQRSTGFVENFIQSLPTELHDEALSRCLPNLAEAEWRARCEAGGNHQSVVAPLISKWTEIYKRASFHRRSSMIHSWGKFGIYLPEHTLEIVALIRSQDAPGAANEEVMYGMFGPASATFSECLQKIPPLLKQIALHHDGLRIRCFDILWVMGCDQPVQTANHNQDHALAAIVQIAKLEFRKRRSVSEDALSWMEAHFAKPEILEQLNKPVWWFVAFIEVFLNHSVVEEKWDGENTLKWSHHELAVNSMTTLRKRILALIRKISLSGHEGILLNCIAVMDIAIDRCNILGIQDDDPLHGKWLPQRIEALDLLGEISGNSNSGLVHWRVWEALDWHLSYEPPSEFRFKAWDVFETLPDGFELRLVRATCSGGGKEITPAYSRERPLGKEDCNYEEKQQVWGLLCVRVAEELAETHSSGATLHHFLEAFVKRAANLAYHPGLGTVLTPLAKEFPDLAESLADEILKSGVPETAHAFGSLMDGLCPTSAAPRVDLVMRAARSSSPILQNEAGRLMVWWQRWNRLPVEGRQFILVMVSEGTAELRQSIVHNVAYLPEGNGGFCVDILKHAIKSSIGESEVEAILALAARILWQDVSQIPPDLIERTLASLLEISDLPQINGRHHFGKIAERYPAEVYGFYRQRINYARLLSENPQDRRRNYQPLPEGRLRVTLSRFAQFGTFQVEFTTLRDEILQELEKVHQTDPGANICHRDGHLLNLQQMARWMLDDAGPKYGPLIGDWITLLRSDDDLALFESVATGDSPTLVLSYPQQLGQLLNHIAEHLPSLLPAAQQSLRFSASRWVGSSLNTRLTEIGEPMPGDGQECHIISRVEKLLQENEFQPVLKTFYGELLRECRAMMKRQLKSESAAFDQDDDFW